MSSLRNQFNSSPAAPPSPSAGGHEMRNYFAARDASRPPLHSSSYTTPYLSLRDRLSQVWINRWTILLLLVLVRTLLAIASLDDSLASAREKALSACTSVESVGSSLASMPHYLSGGVNQLTADGIDKAVNGLINMLTLSLTGVEEIVVFYINLLTSTYVCLITFAVGGSLHVAIDVAEAVGDFLNSTAKDVGADLTKVADGFQNTINSFLSGIDDIGDFFKGKNDPPPKIDLSSQINKLNTLQLPTGYDQGLDKLNASIPTFAEVQNFTNNAIRFPFEEVKKLMNESLPKYAMNRSLFPVPQKEQLTFCSDNNGITDFFAELIRIERLARKVFLAVLLVAAILVCIPMAYREIRRWRLMQSRAKLVTTDAVDNMDAVYLVSRPYTSSAGLMLARKCTSPRRKAMVRWSVAYATTVPALLVLSLALAGLLSCLCQYILLKTIEKEVPALTAEVGQFADKVVYQLNNASEQWAVGANRVILDTNNIINHDVLGWVNTTTGAMNTTLNVFVDEMTKALNVTFGGTPLYDPVMEVLNCLVFLKIQGIEKGLTWVSDHAHVDFPQMPIDTFSIGALEKMSENGNNSILATGPQTDASDEISAAVLKVTKHLANAIRREAIISSCVLAIWVIIALIGIIRSALMFLVPGRHASEPIRHRDPDINGFPEHEKHLPLTHVPSYEQATSGKGISTGNLYQGQAYTLSPKPLPTFKVDSPRQPLHDPPYPTDEKLGMVSAQDVSSATHSPRMTRSSSYGNVTATTPVESTPPTTVHRFPPTFRSQDPFADPR